MSRTIAGSSHYEVFLRKVVLKICSKFTEEHPCRSFCKATLLKSHFGMGILLQICCIFSEHLFLRTTLGGCFRIAHLLDKAYRFSVLWRISCKNFWKNRQLATDVYTKEFDFLLYIKRRVSKITS